MYKSGIWDGLVLSSVMFLSNSAQRAERNGGFWILLPGKGTSFFLMAEKYINIIKASPSKRTQLTDSALGNNTCTFHETPFFTAFPCSAV